MTDLEKQMAEALRFYADGEHNVYLSGKIDWVSERKRLTDLGFSCAGEGYNGGEDWLESGRVAQAALAIFNAQAAEQAAGGGEAVPVAWRVWRGDSYELFFNEDAAKRRCECFVRKGKPEPLYTHPELSDAEIDALRRDAERWNTVETLFAACDGSTSRRILDDLGLPDADEVELLRVAIDGCTAIDAALAARGERPLVQGSGS